MTPNVRVFPIPHLWGKWQVMVRCTWNLRFKSTHHFLGKGIGVPILAFWRHHASTHIGYGWEYM
jgi:hypothetical protein